MSGPTVGVQTSDSTVAEEHRSMPGLTLELACVLEGQKRRGGGAGICFGQLVLAGDKDPLLRALRGS